MGGNRLWASKGEWRRNVNEGKARTKEQPSLVKNRSVSILRSGQKGLGVEMSQLTSMKIQKTGSVSLDSAWRMNELTLRPSSPLGVLDLSDGEWIVRGVQGEQYLVGKRQDIVIVIEHLHCHHTVLREGVTVGSTD